MKLWLTPSGPTLEVAHQYSPSEAMIYLPQERSLYIERPPSFVYDPHNTGFGASLVNGWTTPRTPVAYRRVQNARSIGQRLIVNRDGQVILDDILKTSDECEAQMRRFADRSTSLFFEDTDIVATPDGYSSARLDTPWQVIDEPVLSLLSIEPSNYGSWLFRVLPKLLLRQQIGENLKVVCWCPIPWQRKMLHFFGVADQDIIEINLGACYQFREMYVPTVLNPVAYLSEETLLFYRRTLERHNIWQQRSRFLYISRRSRAATVNFQNVRHFVNEALAIKAFEALGFEIVEPETMSIAEQARTFASAAMVVGASGAGMFNTAFCMPGTGVIDIEAFPHWLYAHCNYFSSCGHTYGIAFGLADTEDPSPTHKRWSIDIPGLTRKVAEMKALVSV